MIRVTIGMFLEDKFGNVLKVVKINGDGAEVVFDDGTKGFTSIGDLEDMNPSKVRFASRLDSIALAAVRRELGVGEFKLEV